MEITVKQKVNVPLSPFCGKCIRQEEDKHGGKFCSLFNRFIFMQKGDYVKCRECYNALYAWIERRDDDG